MAPVGHRVDACGTTTVGPELVRRSPKSHPRPLTARECATLERLAQGKTQKMIAFEFGISINTVGNLAANAYKKLGVHGAAGNQKTAGQLDGQDLYLGLNAYVYAEPKAK